MNSVCKGKYTNVVHTMIITSAVNLVRAKGIATYLVDLRKMTLVFQWY